LSQLSAQRKSLQFLGGAQAPAEARTAVGGVCEGVDSELRETVVLLVSELVTNSVRHGRGQVDEQVKLEIELAANSLRVAVSDQGPGFVPSTRRHRPTAGWGLVIVDELADRWGVTRGGRTVWFECDLSDF
jgi:anti-sigma regulatory factor (Ser/Thr protein kinase)